MTLQDLFDDLCKWTQGATARDENGRSVAPGSSEAVSYCLQGGALICCRTPDEFLEVMNKLRAAAGVDILWKWNDAYNRTFKEVRELIEKANV